MLTEEQAIRLAETKFWETMTDHDIAKFQLFEDRLCMPFGVFHRAIEKALGRPVWTHEFATPEKLQADNGRDHQSDPEGQTGDNLCPA